MKKLTATLLPVLLVFAACGDQRPKERISGSSRVNIQEKINNLYSPAGLLAFKKKLVEGKKTDLATIREEAEKTFKTLINAGQPAVKIDPKKNKNNDDDNDENEEQTKLQQKPKNDVWSALRVIEVNPQDKQFSIRLKINTDNIRLSGAFTSPKEVSALSTGEAPEASGALKIDALSVCITDDCHKIVSIVHLDPNTYRVIVTGRQVLTKNSRTSAQAKEIKNASADIHHIVGAQQEQMVIYLSFADGSTAKLISKLNVQEVLDSEDQSEFNSEGTGEKTRVSIIDSKTIRIFNLDSTPTDDHWLDLPDNF